MFTFWPDHVPAIIVKSCENKEVPFSPMNISLLAFFNKKNWQKMDFGPILRFWPQRKISRFSFPTLRNGSVVSHSDFFGELHM